jgi:hypothetical protein
MRAILQGPHQVIVQPAQRITLKSRPDEILGGRTGYRAESSKGRHLPTLLQGCSVRCHRNDIEAEPMVMLAKRLDVTP